MDNPPINDSSGEASEGKFFEGKFFEAADYPVLYQDSHTSCVLCHLLDTGLAHHTLIGEGLDSRDVRSLYSHSIGFTGSESVCEVCQKLTCLPNLQPTPAEKESSMQNSINTEHNSVHSSVYNKPETPSDMAAHNHSPEWTSSLFTHPIPVDRTPNLTGNLTGNSIGNPVKKAINSGSDMGALRREIRSMRAQLQSSRQTLRSMRHQVESLTDQLVQSALQIQTYQAESLTREKRHQFDIDQLAQKLQTQPAVGFGLKTAARQPRQPVAQAQIHKPEPAMMPTTYQVPRRSRSTFLDRLTGSIPFSILTIVGGISLAAVVALTFSAPGLWLGVSEVIVTVIRGLFVAIAFSSAIALMLELTQ